MQEPRWKEQAGSDSECLERERDTQCSRYEWRRSMPESWHAIPKARWEKKGGEAGRRKRRNTSEEKMEKRKMDINRGKDRSGNEDGGGGEESLEGFLGFGGEKRGRLASLLTRHSRRFV